MWTLIDYFENNDVNINENATATQDNNLVDILVLEGDTVPSNMSLGEREIPRHQNAFNDKSGHIRTTPLSRKLSTR